MKKIHLQLYYMIPDDAQWIAVNQDGTVVCFKNAPIRDYKLGVWQDSVTGDYGDLMQYDQWTMMVRRASTFKNWLNHNVMPVVRTNNRKKRAQAAQKEGNDGHGEKVLLGRSDPAGQTD